MPDELYIGMDLYEKNMFVKFWPCAKLIRVNRKTLQLVIKIKGDDNLKISKPPKFFRKKSGGGHIDS